MVYKKIDELYEKLISLGIKVSGDYKSKLPSIKTTTGNSYYNQKENTIYINPSDKKLGDSISEESMHFLHYVTQGNIGSDIGGVHEYQYIDEFIGAAGRLIGKSGKDVRLSKKEVRESLEELRKRKEKALSFSDKLKVVRSKLEQYKIFEKDMENISDFFLDIILGKKSKEELTKEYENNNIFKKYLGEQYEQIKKLIEIPKDQRSDEDKQKLDNLHRYFVRKHSEIFKEIAYFEIASTRAEVQPLLSDVTGYSMVSHKKGYDLIQKVYESGLEKFLKKNPNFLLESYEQKEQDIKKFIRSIPNRARRLKKKVKRK